MSNYIVKIKDYMRWFNCSRGTASKLFKNDIEEFKRKVILYSDILIYYGDLDKPLPKMIKN